MGDKRDFEAWSYVVYALDTERDEDRVEYWILRAVRRARRVIRAEREFGGGS